MNKIRIFGWKLKMGLLATIANNNHIDDDESS